MERRKILQLIGAAAITRNFRLQEALLPLFPLNLVLFPHTNLPLHIFEERYKEMIGEVLSNGSEFGILLVQEQTLRLIGCTASVAKVLDRFPDGRVNILVRGRRPFEISMLNEDKAYLQGRPEFLADGPGDAGEEKLRRTAIQLYSRLRNEAELENESFLDGSPAEDDSQLSYRLMAGVPGELGWKQDLLELRSEPERLSRVIRHLEQLMEYVDRERRSNPANRQII